jgi:hypothetical protein
MKKMRPRWRRNEKDAAAGGAMKKMRPRSRRDEQRYSRPRRPCKNRRTAGSASSPIARS